VSPIVHTVVPGSTRPPGRRIPVFLAVLTLLASASTAVAFAAPARAAALPTGWATVVNAGSGKCVDARSAGTAVGAAVQQYACDPPNQAARMNGSTQGYAAYKVANSVTSHQVYGFGSYCYFNVNPSVIAEQAIEAPNSANVRFRDMVTVSLGGTGTIRHVINDRGGPSNSPTNVADLVGYP